MEQSGMSTGRNARKKCESKRRTWTKREEEVLIAELHDLLANSWKCENGFRPGYLTALENGMKHQLPGTDLKAMPHIHSKVGSWRVQYCALFDMMNKSGLGWNNQDNTITVDKTFDWEGFCKTNPSAITMRYKSWPFFHDWGTIFGKDRATGEIAVDHTNPSQPTMSFTNPYPEEDRLSDMNDLGIQDESIPSPQQQNKASSSNLSKGKKKRKNQDITEEAIVEVLSKLNETTSEMLGAFVQRTQNQSEPSRERKGVDSYLKQIEWLQAEDRLNVGRYLVNHLEEMEHFYSIDMADRELMVSMIIREKF